MNTLPSVFSNLPGLAEEGVQDEQALLAEMGEWHQHLDHLLDANVRQEVQVAEMAKDVAGWCRGAGKDAAASLARQATSLLPRNLPATSLQHLRQKSSPAKGKGTAAKRAPRGWLSSTFLLLTGSPAKAQRSEGRSSRAERVGSSQRSERYTVGADEPLKRMMSDAGPRSSYDRPKSDRVRRSKSDVDYGMSEPDASTRCPSSSTRHLRPSTIDAASDDGAWERTNIERLRREVSRDLSSCGGDDRGDGPAARGSISRRQLREREKEERESARGKTDGGRAGAPVGGGKQETLQTQLLRMPYYLFQGLVLITFVTDKVSHVNLLSSIRKKVLVGMMALSIGNFFSSTTTARSNILFLALRAMCDFLNIAHALSLILLSIWAPALPANSRALAAWLAHFPSLAAFLGISCSQVGPILGTFNLITGATYIYMLYACICVKRESLCVCVGERDVRVRSRECACVCE